MKKITKVLAALSFYFFLLVIDGCTDCGCPDISLTFFDYRKIEVSVEDEVLNSNDDLAFQFALDSIYFLALKNESCWNLGLINTALACSCNEPGDGGWKFPIQQIDIFSNKDFNSTLLANTSLNSIMTVFNSSQSTPLADANQEDFRRLEFTRDISSSSHFKIFTTEQADELNVPHIFTIQFTKSNGEIISTQTPPITWN